MRLKILLVLFTVALGVFIFVNTVQSPSPTPNIIQNCMQITCQDSGTPSCDCGQVNQSDNTYADGSGLTSAGALAQVHTWHNQTDVSNGSKIVSVILNIEWFVNIDGTCSIEVYNDTWNTINTSCMLTENNYSYDISNVSTNETLAENVQVRINYTVGGASSLKVDHIYINITYLPPHEFDSWNLTNFTSGAVIQSGQNFTRSDFFNTSVHWLADGIENATIEHNGTGNFTNYTISSPFPDNWTNYTINLSNTSQFTLAGNITVRAIYSTDIYGQQNSTQGIRYFSLFGFADVSSLGFSRSTILNGTNTTLLCNVTDSNSSAGIPNYNVSFFKNNTLLDYNLTNTSGIAVLEYSDNTTIINFTTQIIEFKCNITNQLDIFYNASVAEQSSNLSIVDVFAINLTENHSVYNRGENLTLTVLDTSNNSIANITWIVNLTKFNESEEMLYNETNDTFTFSINSTDPLRNWTLFANITVEGHTLNQTWYFNVSNNLTPYFVVPTSTQFGPGATFTPRIKVNYSRNEELDYLVNVNLSCSAGTLVLSNTTDPPYGDVYKNTTECQAPSSFGASFTITVNASDNFNNSGSLELSLSTSPAPSGGNGGSSTGGGPPPSCGCEEWTSNTICGFGTCSGNEILQTRVCNPVELCVNETTQRCIENPACFGVSNFNFTINPTSIQLIQGESTSIIKLNIENTGGIPLQINITIEETPLIVFVIEEFEILENESREFPIDIYVPLTLSTGQYIITLNLSSRILEKTKTITVTVLENELIPEIEQLENELSTLEEDIRRYKESGVNVFDIEELARQVSQALEHAKNSIQQDNLTELDTQISIAKAKIDSVRTGLLVKNIEKFLAENWLFIIFGAIIIFILSYLMTQILIPFYTLGKEIKSLAKEEKELVKARIETEKQYFRREIDEKTFKTILTEGQSKILRIRGSLKTKTEFRKTLLKTRLTSRALARWIKRLVPKRKQNIKRNNAAQKFKKLSHFRLNREKLQKKQEEKEQKKTVEKIKEEKEPKPEKKLEEKKEEPRVEKKEEKPKEKKKETKMEEKKVETKTEKQEESVKEEKPKPKKPFHSSFRKYEKQKLAKEIPKKPVKKHKNFDLSEKKTLKKSKDIRQELLRDLEKIISKRNSFRKKRKPKRKNKVIST